MKPIHILTPNEHYIYLSKNKKFRRLFLVFTLITFLNITYSQDLHSSLQVRNSHLWRGIEVTSGFVFTGDLHLDGKHFYGGFWGGGNAEGSYKEFNNYVGFKKGRFNVELWDIYNFSPGATYNNEEYFNYNASETGRFLDFRSNFTISEKFPLTLSWNVILFGRDRNMANTENKYSYFTSTQYCFYKKENLQVDGRIGYAAAVNKAGEQNNFFAGNSGINEVSLLLSNVVTVMGYKLPIGIWAMWNPVDNNAYLQFSAQAYSF
ncbi:hypothetical protein [Flavobacterium sp. LAR06]|uniref:hypothetical protein n=1 Tax=Flavobacterium sp. LAR06 TaxID=3064897 RepID=UPI0035BEE19A